MTDSRATEQRALVVCGAWLNAGLVGAAAIAAALIGVIDGHMGALAALSLAIPGAFVATACWRRARNVVERALAEESSTAGVVQPRAHGTKPAAGSAIVVRRSAAIEPEARR